MSKYTINLDKVSEFIFEEPFVTTEMVETYELDDEGSDELTLTSRQRHEIKNNSCDMIQLKMGFINQFIEQIINDEANDTVIETMLKYGYLDKND